MIVGLMRRAITYASEADPVKQKKSRSGHSFAFPAANQKKDRDSEKDDPQHSQGWPTTTRIDDGIPEQQNGRNYEDGGNHRIARDSEWRFVVRPPAQDKDRSDSEGVERHDGGNEGVGELLESSDEDKQHSKSCFERDRYSRRLKFPVDLRYRFE
jgi:hypothetical protein